MVVALRTDRIDATRVIDGPMDGAGFSTYLRHCLAPTLSLGDIGATGNLLAYKVAGVRDILETAAAQLGYLPPCTPDLNPSKMHFPYTQNSDPKRR